MTYLATSTFSPGYQKYGGDVNIVKKVHLSTFIVLKYILQNSSKLREKLSFRKTIFNILYRLF